MTDKTELPEPAAIVCLGAGERYAHDQLIEVQLQKAEGVSFSPGTKFYTADQVRQLLATRAPAAVAEGKWYFAADPAQGVFEVHGSLDEAKANAQELLADAADEAADSGWADDPPQICYGVILGECVEKSRATAPAESDFGEIVEFELRPTAESSEP